MSALHLAASENSLKDHKYYNVEYIVLSLCLRFQQLTEMNSATVTMTVTTYRKLGALTLSLEMLLAVEHKIIYVPVPLMFRTNCIFSST